MVVQSSDLQQSLPGSIVAVRFHLNHHRFQSHHSFTARFFQIHILQLGPSAADLHGKIPAFFVANPGAAPSVGVADDTQDAVALQPIVGGDTGSNCCDSPRAIHDLPEDDNVDPVTPSATGASIVVNHQSTSKHFDELKDKGKHKADQLEGGHSKRAHV